MHVYELARAYQVAFSYRDVPAEVNALLGWYARHAGGVPTRVLELAAGPADHAREFAGRGAQATALDLSAPMCAYARDRAAADGVELDVVQGDMTDFDLGDRRFDLSMVLLSSDSHILDLDGFVGHLRSVARHLVPGGLHVMEQTHPSDVLGSTGMTQAEWDAEGDGLKVSVRWGAEGDSTDPVTQIRQTAVELRIDDGTGVRVVRDRVAERQWTLTEVTAAVRLAGDFDIVHRYGAYKDIDVADPKAWRMIPILRRR